MKYFQYYSLMGIGALNLMMQCADIPGLRLLFGFLSAAMGLATMVALYVETE